jgi:hypothetical protein
MSDDTRSIVMADAWGLLRPLLILNLTISGTFSNADTRGAHLDEYPYAPAVVNRIVQGEYKLLRVTGEINGVAVTGTGEYTFSPAIAATLAGQPVMSNERALTTRLWNKKGKTKMELSTNSITYYDSNYGYLAELDQRPAPSDNELSFRGYAVIDRKISAPTTIRANDFGSLSSMTVYKDQTRSIKLGTITRSYVVEPDTASSVIYRIRERHYGTNGGFIRSDEGRYRFDKAGNCTLVSIDNRQKNSKLHFEAAQ